MIDVLRQVEAALDPARPDNVEVLAYGEISATLAVPALPDVVVKRMSGFADRAMAGAYADLIDEYCTILRREGVAVVDTAVHVVERAVMPPVVYLVQPRVADLGSDLLRTGSDDVLTDAVRAVLDRVWRLYRRTEPPEVAIDAQLSNWSFTDPDDPVLVDVGTPFIRREGRHLFDVEIVLSAMPPPIRPYYRRGVAAAYMDDYFVPRLVLLDLLGNFIKEQAAHRLHIGVAAANHWLAEHDLDGIDRGEVERYYRKDAAALGMFLRVRRMDRAVRRLFGRRYDFILPGRIVR